MHSSPLPRRTPLVALSTILLTAVFLLIAPLAASAHDELIGTDPAADSTADTLPAQIVLRFSADILDAEGATMVQVTDPSGAPVVAGAPVVDGSTVTQQLAEGGPAGAYRVAWKVVSGDGHPIAGEYAFTVATGSAGATTSPAPTPTPTSEKSTPAPTVTVTASPAPASSAASQVWLWGLLIVAILVVAGIAVWLGLRRKPSTPAPDSSPAGPAETER